MVKFKPLKDLYGHLQVLVETKLWAKVLLGLFLGIITGLFLGPAAGIVSPDLSQTITSWLALPGNLFIRLVQMIMIPLIITSIIQGIAGGDNKDTLLKMGPNVGIYFVLTTLISIVIGVAVALLIQPGTYIESIEMGPVTDVEVDAEGSPFTNVPQLISNLLPNNPLVSMISGEMLEIVIFSIIVGVALISLSDEKAGPVVTLVYSIQEICMVITKWAMRIAPYAVFGLICQIIASVGLEAIAGLSVYMLTVVAGLLIILVMYCLILITMAAQNLKHFFGSVREVLLLAFSVASSAAVMPLSMKTAEEKLGFDRGVVQFVIPIGATINMNGTAAYQAIATIFLAQVYGLELSLMGILVVVLTTVAASIGTPSSPGAGVIILATVLSSVGIPLEGIALIIGVDNVLGMMRTAVNVTGDLTACAVFNARHQKRIREGNIAVSDATA